MGFTSSGHREDIWITSALYLIYYLSKYRASKNNDCNKNLRQIKNYGNVDVQNSIVQEFANALLFFVIFFL